MKIYHSKLYPIAIFIPLIIITGSFIFLASFLSDTNQKNTDIRSKAAGGNTITVCPEATSGCSFVGGDGIQQAVDNAQNGDTILLQPGRYIRRNPTDDPKIKYRFCMVNTRGKTLTIKGPGALLDGENGGFNYGSAEGAMIIGICDQGGNVTIDSLQIKQTLRPAIFLRDSNAVVKNVTFIDIDNTPIDVWMGSKVIIVNNIFLGSAGPGISILPLPGNVSAIIQNNTIFGTDGAGVTFNLCNNSQVSGSVENNIIVADTGISATCPDQTQKISAIKTANNIVWKGKKGDCSSMEDDVSQTGCSSPELCTGTTIANPNFNGADEKGSVCVWGEGITAGDLHTRPGSPAGGAGAYTGVCADANSAACLSYIEQQKSQFQPSPVPTEAIPTSEPYQPPSEQPPNNNLPDNQPPAKPPTDDNGPPITYYLPPTMSFENPNQPTNSPSLNPPTGGGETLPTPTVTPTPKPIIDVGKTVETVRNTWSNFITAFIQFTKNILP